ncbi:male sterility protein-domain-containing protein [Hysterangium stoloniferum]|nr:male sterility protein-domain-containing protein [Hysterangium stoloniferum]
MSPTPLRPDDPVCLDNVLIPDLYTQIGTQFPERLFARVLIEDENNNSHLEDITWGRLYQDSVAAADALLHWGALDLGSSDSPVVFAILALSSYRYYTYVVGAWLNGWAPLLLSTRNSIPAIHHLLSTVNSKCILLDSTTEHVEGELKNLLPELVTLKLQDIPDVAKSSTPRDIQLGHRLSVNDVALYMHTSGSSGMEISLIPIRSTHRHFVDSIKDRTAKSFAGLAAYTPLPLFHGMGLYPATCWPIGSGVVPTFFTLRRPLNAIDLLRHLKELGSSLSFISPSLLEDIVDGGDEMIALLREYSRTILFGGGPLRETAGNTLVAKGVPLMNVFGMSETMLITDIDNPPIDRINDWIYMRFREDIFKLHFLPIDNSGQCELVVGTLANEPLVFNHELGFATNDVWEPHPKEKGLWKHVGRKDNVASTVLSTGEKTDDRQLVSLLSQDDRIGQIVIFGAARPLNGVIISPAKRSTDDFDPDKFRESIWETVEMANTIIPKHSRLIRQMVLIEKPSKPFVTSDKGSVKTRDTRALYEDEINAAYDSLKGGYETQTSLLEVDEMHVRGTLRDIIWNICGEPLDDNMDIFDTGADSVVAIQIRAALISLIKNSGSDISVPANIVYIRPTINQLTTFTLNCIRGVLNQDRADDRCNQIDECIHRFSFAPTAPPTILVNDITVLLTGSTGSLGSHVLDRLLDRPDVKHVYCLLRDGKTLDHLKNAFKIRSLSVDKLVEESDRIGVYSSDFSKRGLGLPLNILDRIQADVTHIFHCAWDLNFKLPLEKFESQHIGGVLNLIELARSSKRTRLPRFAFSSSIGAVSSYPKSSIPERGFYDPGVTGTTGYGQAKYISEVLIDSASRTLRMPATIIRSGQLSGSTINGYWSRTEFIPRLFASSLSLGIFPDTMPAAAWLPVDIAAAGFIDLALDEKSSLSYYHLENPVTTSWSDITKMFLAASNGKVKVIPTEEWIKQVEKTANASMALKTQLTSTNPAVFLLEFYSELMASSDTWRALDVSLSVQIAPSMKFGAVAPELVKKYVRWALINTDSENGL